MTEIDDRLAELRESGLYRRTRMISGPQGPRVVLDGKPVLLLCSNNYLGLADHPRVREAAADAAMRWGVGAGASRLVSGTMTVHRRLEERLAAFEGSDAAVLFGSGYLANLGVVSALARQGGVVLSDELNHASIVDGCRLARADTFVYRHCDVEHLAWGLRNASGRSALVVTDSVFSMDGDVAPLAEIVELARRHRVRVVVDEAHGTGCLGRGGRGAVHEAGVEDEVDVVIGTLGKALGSYGAYAACDQAMAQLLVNTARPFVYSTAPPPPAVAGALAAIELLASEPQRVDRLRANAAALREGLHREGFDVSGSTTQIVPIVVGDPQQAMRMCELAIEDGVFAQAIRPPTVPEGTSRLRLAVMASHTREELRAAARTLGRAALRAGFRPAAGVPAVAAREGLARPFDAETEPAVPVGGAAGRGATGRGGFHGAFDGAFDDAFADAFAGGAAGRGVTDRGESGGAFDGAFAGGSPQGPVPAEALDGRASDGAFDESDTRATDRGPHAARPGPARPFDAETDIPRAA